MVGEVKATMRAMGAVTGTSPLGVPELVVASEVVVAVARVLRNVNPGGGHVHRACDWCPAAGVT